MICYPRAARNLAMQRRPLIRGISPEEWRLRLARVSDPNARLWAASIITFDCSSYWDHETAVQWRREHSGIPDTSDHSVLARALTLMEYPYPDERARTPKDRAHNPGGTETPLRNYPEHRRNTLDNWKGTL